MRKTKKWEKNISDVEKKRKEWVREADRGNGRGKNGREMGKEWRKKK